MPKPATIEVENVNHPGKVERVNAAKYAEMKRVLLKVVPKTQPGVTQKEMLEAVRPHLDSELFPNGETSGWWAKTVQLDLEAKGKLGRSQKKPLTWHRL